MAVLSGWCVLALLRRTPSRLDVIVAGALGALAAGWLLQSPAYEGPGILALTDSSGLAAADMGVPPSFFLSGAVLYAAWRDRRRARDRALRAPSGARTQPPERH